VETNKENPSEHRDAAVTNKHYEYWREHVALGRIWLVNASLARNELE
jgi:hypothetical protein